MEIINLPFVSDDGISFQDGPQYLKMDDIDIEN